MQHGCPEARGRHRLVQEAHGLDVVGKDEDPRQVPQRAALLLRFCLRISASESFQTSAPSPQRRVITPTGSKVNANTVKGLGREAPQVVLALEGVFLKTAV